MRQIKFRAWGIANKHMYYDLLNCFYHNKTGNFIADTDKAMKTMGLDQVVLMQFTGLKDKNGNDIYEGDVLKSGKVGEKDPKHLRVWVVWNDNLARFELEDNQGDGEYSLTYKNWEIVGNIYQTPTSIE